MNGIFLHAQQIKGKISSESKELADVHVINRSTSKATITNGSGYFSISAKLNDTLVFSAVQFKKKELVISQSMLDSRALFVPLEDAVNELNEVVVTPYNLSGNINKDLGSIQIGPVLTASTLGLPNANVPIPLQSERKLHDADHGKFAYYYGIAVIVNLNKVLTRISGRTKMLKQHVARDKKYLKTQALNSVYTDSLFIRELKIPKAHISNFMYYCEVDPNFEGITNTEDNIKIWDFFITKSALYRKNNNLVPN